MPFEEENSFTKLNKDRLRKILDAGRSKYRENLYVKDKNYFILLELLSPFVEDRLSFAELLLKERDFYNSVYFEDFALSLYKIIKDEKAFAELKEIFASLPLNVFLYIAVNYYYIKICVKDLKEFVNYIKLKRKPSTDMNFIAELSIIFPEAFLKFNKTYDNDEELMNSLANFLQKYLHLSSTDENAFKTAIDFVRDVLFYLSSLRNKEIASLFLKEPFFVKNILMVDFLELNEFVNKCSYANEIFSIVFKGDTILENLKVLSNFFEVISSFALPKNIEKDFFKAYINVFIKNNQIISVDKKIVRSFFEFLFDNFSYEGSLKILQSMDYINILIFNEFLSIEYNRFSAFFKNKEEYLNFIIEIIQKRKFIDIKFFDYGSVYKIYSLLDGKIDIRDLFFSLLRYYENSKYLNEKEFFEDLYDFISDDLFINYAKEKIKYFLDKFFNKEKPFSITDIKDALYIFFAYSSSLDEAIYISLKFSDIVNKHKYSIDSLTITFRSFAEFLDLINASKEDLYRYLDFFENRTVLAFKIFFDLYNNDLISLVYYYKIDIEKLKDPKYLESFYKAVIALKTVYGGEILDIGLKDILDNFNEFSFYRSLLKIKTQESNEDFFNTYKKGALISFVLSMLDRKLYREIMQYTNKGLFEDAVFNLDRIISESFDPNLPNYEESFSVEKDISIDENIFFSFNYEKQERILQRLMKYNSLKNAYDGSADYFIRNIDDFLYFFEDKEKAKDRIERIARLIQTKKKEKAKAKLSENIFNMLLLEIYDDSFANYFVKKALSQIQQKGRERVKAIFYLMRYGSILYDILPFEEPYKRIFFEIMLKKSKFLNEVKRIYNNYILQANYDIKVIFGKKSLANVLLSKKAKTCFGDSINITKRKEIISLPILLNGKTYGKVDLYVPYGDFRKSKQLVLFGIYPSYELLDKVGHSYSLEIIRKIIQIVRKYAIINDAELFISDAGGFSNIEGTYKLFKDFAKKEKFSLVKPLTNIHPYYGYDIYFAYRLT